MIIYDSLIVDTSKRLQVLDLTDRINHLLKKSPIVRGLVNLWTVHTTAALTINEKDKGLWADILVKFAQLTPIEGDYDHKPNAYAHILSSIVKPDITIPVLSGKMALGTWQRVLFLELDGPRKRTIKVTIIGE
jgi:secondary thiamine-phosphate synthase enzyme